MKFLINSRRAVAGFLLVTSMGSVMAAGVASSLTNIEFSIKDLKADGIPAQFSYGAGVSETDITVFSAAGPIVNESVVKPGEFFDIQSGYTGPDIFFPVNYSMLANVGADSLVTQAFVGSEPSSFGVIAKVNDTGVALKVAPHTRLNITGDANFFISLYNTPLGPDTVTSLVATAGMRADGELFGQSVEQLYFGPESTFTDMQMNQHYKLQLVLINDSDSYKSANLSMWAISTGRIYAPSAVSDVPEANAIALAFGGLSVVGLIFLRRKDVHSH